MLKQYVMITDITEVGSQVYKSKSPCSSQTGTGKNQMSIALWTEQAMDTLSTLKTTLA